MRVKFGVGLALRRELFALYYVTPRGLDLGQENVPGHPKYVMLYVFPPFVLQENWNLDFLSYIQDDLMCDCFQ